MNNTFNDLLSKKLTCLLGLDLNTKYSALIFLICSLTALHPKGCQRKTPLLHIYFTPLIQDSCNFSCVLNFCYLRQYLSKKKTDLNIYSILFINYYHLKQ